MAEPYIIKMPQLSDTMTEGVIVSWEKKIGDKISRGDIVATVETDKAIMDVEVFRDGYLSGPMAAVDSTVHVGEPIAYLVESAEEVSRHGEVGEAPKPRATELPKKVELAHGPDVHAGEPAGTLHVIKMPQLSDTMTAGVVVSWEKQPGDKISRGDIVATVETDKAIMDVEVFRDGYLSGPMAAVDSTVHVGEPIAYLVASAEEVSRHGEVGEAPKPRATELPKKVELAHGPDVHAGEPAGTLHVIKMPQLSDTMTEGVVVSWEKQPGDKITRGDIVATVETDKAIMDVEVFREGYLSGPLAAVDSTVHVGAPLAYLVETAEQAVSEITAVAAPQKPAQKMEHGPAAVTAYITQPAIEAPPAPRPTNKSATPLARKLAASLHVNLNN